MTELEHFLSRWSRLKQDAEYTVEEPVVAPAPEPEAGVAGEVPAEAAGENKEPEFDASTLPPVDSIDAATDVRSFLQKGVPMDLTRAALRRAWSADPAIRDFIEVAENQWDFATGSNIPGFGPLEASDDLRRMVAEMFDGPTMPVEGRATMTAVPPAQSSQSAPASYDFNVAEEPSGLLNSESQNETRRLSVQVPIEANNHIVRREEDNIAAQQVEQDSENSLPIVRAHGRALPQ